jgi:hypothetical protein
MHGCTLEAVAQRGEGCTKMGDERKKGGYLVKQYGGAPVLSTT